MGNNNIDDSEIYFYCSRCLSLAVVQDKRGVLTCQHCGAGPKHIDFCDFDRWDELYRKKYGHPLIEKKGVYDDLDEVYEEETPTEMTFSEALSNGMIVRDVINLKITD